MDIKKLEKNLIQQFSEIKKNPYNNSYARKQIKCHHQQILEHAVIPNFDPADVKNTLTVRYNLLNNYITEFGTYFQPYYMLASPKKKQKIENILGFDRTLKICKSIKTKKKAHYITINEVYNLFCGLNLKKDFIIYFASKTAMSFSIHNKKIKAIANLHYYEKHEKQLALKFSQFVYMILCEYIAIHNLMFVSGYKIPEIKSIDKYLKNI